MPDETAVEKGPEVPATPPEVAPSLTPAHAELEGAMGEQHNVVAKLKEDLAKEQEKLDGLINQHNKLPKPLPGGVETLRVSRADSSFKENRG